ncbi:MAG TPA: ABC transporter ATP-binding protein [Desulfobacteraceae bacterium]|nr:ABC transporter ATP-binding protein [Desulfobacteraceae bacterium]
MIRDYGYIEDGKLGRPYDMRLLKRLLAYAAPCRKPIALSLMFSLIITLADLAMPYFSKIAIDRYIVPSWYKIVNVQQSPELLTKLRPHLLDSKNGRFYLISSREIKRIDPRLLKKYGNANILEKGRFYLIRGRNLADLPPHLRDSAQLMADGSIIIPLTQLQGLGAREIALIRQTDLHGLTVVGLILAGLILVSFTLGYLEYYLLEYTGQHIMQDIRMRLFANIQEQSVRFFLKHPLGRLVTRVTNDVENLNEMLKSVAITLFKDFFILTGILVVLFYMDWPLALVCVILIPFISLTTYVFSSMAREAFRELRAKVAKINAFLSERLGNVQLIQLFCAEKAQEEAFNQINHENFLAGMKQIRIFALFMPLMELLSSLGVALILWYGGSKVIQDRITLGALVAFLSYMQMFFKPIRDISEKYNIMQSALASIERIFQFMDSQEKMPEPLEPIQPNVLEGKLQVSKVSFSYDDAAPVLRGISLELKPGQTVGVVGPTGSGKTTLANLLLRMYDPDEGAIYLDGVDLRKWPNTLLHKQMAPVMQDVFIFSGTLEGNITLGRKGISRQDMEQILRVTNLYQFVSNLPDGLGYMVGERGENLSSGQRQLLSFARALVGKPRILVLDEATSSVDPETEALVRDALGNIVAGQTTLIIAHRLSTVRHASQIFVLNKGKIVEQGTHEELMALRGIYYRLIRLQEKM